MYKMFNRNKYQKYLKNDLIQKIIFLFCQQITKYIHSFVKVFKLYKNTLYDY